MLTCLQRGREGVSELEDYSYNSTKTRRRTNSMSMAAGHSALKTKFEDLDPEAIVEYEEYIHGPSAAEMAEENELNLEKMSSSSSADTMASVEEDMDVVAGAPMEKK